MSPAHSRSSGSALSRGHRLDQSVQQVIPELTRLEHQPAPLPDDLVDLVIADIRKDPGTGQRRFPATAGAADQDKRATPASLFTQPRADRNDFIFAAKEDRRMVSTRTPPDRGTADPGQRCSRPAGPGRRPSTNPGGWSGGCAIAGRTWSAGRSCGKREY